MGKFMKFQNKERASDNPSIPAGLIPRQSKKKNFLSNLGIVSIILIVIVVFFSIEKKNPKQVKWEKIPEGVEAPDAIITGFHLISSYEGHKEWDLIASTAKLFQHQKKAYANHIFAKYYKNGKVVSVLRADKGIINTTTNNTAVEGHVSLITENGTRLTTNYLQWVNSKQLIETNQFVHIIKGQNNITAIGMVSDANLDNIHFDKDVQTEIRNVKEIKNFDKSKF
jgi:LPS export ABC transporter protein LptC